MMSIKQLALQYRFFVYTIIDDVGNIENIPKAKMLSLEKTNTKQCLESKIAERHSIIRPIRNLDVFTSNKNRLTLRLL